MTQRKTRDLTETKNRVCGYLPLTTCLPPPSTNLQRQVLVEKVSEKLSIVLVENNKVNEQSLREQSLRMVVELS